MREHELDNANCPHCWKGFPAWHYCGGLVHAELNISSDPYWIINTECTKCTQLEGS